MSRGIGAKAGIAASLTILGFCALAQGDLTAARVLCEESLALNRAIGDSMDIGNALGVLGAVALEQGDTTAARAHYEEGLALCRAIDQAWGGADHTLSLGLVTRAEGQLDRAEALFADVLAQCHTRGLRVKLPTGLAALAVAAAERAVGAQAVTFAERAARLGGAAAAILEAIQVLIEWQFRKPYEQAIATARAILGDEAFNAAWAAGKRLTLDEAVAFALELDPSRS